MRDACPTRAARKILRLAISIAPDDTPEWGQRMLSEPNQVQGNWAALLWAIGGASVVAKQAALSAIFRDGGRHALPLSRALFEKETSMSKTLLALSAEMPHSRGSLVSVVSAWPTTHRDGFLTRPRWIYFQGVNNLTVVGETVSHYRVLPKLGNGGMGVVFEAEDKKNDADAALSEFVAKYSDDSAYQVASAYAFRGQTEKAFEWLHKAYARRDPGLSDIKVDPLLLSIRGDTRYSAFLKTMRLPP